MSLRLATTTHQAAYPANQAQTVYALLELKPEAVAGRMPLDLRVALDESGSMSAESAAGSRQNKLELLKAAVTAMIEKLEPGDRLTLISFDDRAHMRYQGVIHSASDRKAAIQAVKRIHGGGGTSILAGLEAAIAEAPLPDALGRLVLVTDGEGLGAEERDCERLAFDARGRQGWLVFGIGVDYNDAFLERLAGANGGAYVHLGSAERAVDVFAREAQAMADVAVTGLVVELTAEPGVELVRLDRIVPLTQAVPVHLPGYVSVDLGDVDRARGQQLLVQLSVPALAPGSAVLAKVRCGYHVPARKLLNQTLDAELAITVSTDAAALVADAGVLRTVQLAGANRLYTLGLAEMASGDGAAAVKTLASSAAVYDQLGLDGLGDRLKTLTSTAGAGPLAADAEEVKRTLTTMTREAWRLTELNDVP